MSTYPTGSYLSDLDGLSLRIIQAQLTMSGSDCSRVHESYRLITTLLDHDLLTSSSRAMRTCVRPRRGC